MKSAAGGFVKSEFEQDFGDGVDEYDDDDDEEMERVMQGFAS